MPSNPPIPVSENLPRGILLVEEYGALGVAISSALRKFASLHRVEVAHDFAEAKTLAAKIRPELFVLDLDPPHSDEIEFLNQLKAQYPEARVLVIAAGISREVRDARGTAGAIQFIEKPFDLAEFGAAIQALVGPWTGPAGSTRGTLRDLGFIDIAEVKCLANASARVRLEAADGQVGEVHFQKGQISHAAIGLMTGVPALEEIIGWPEAKMSEGELPTEAPRTIDTPRDALLLQVFRKLAEKIRESSGNAPPTQPPPVRNGRKILVIDDTDMLLIFVADVLATADQDFQILTAASGGTGLKLAREARPDLILLDYCLADMTGDKVCRALLENEATARIPVLMMSGHLTELARTAEDYGNVVAALPKPFLSGALINAVEKALAAGPLPKADRPKVKTTPPAPSPAPAPVAEEQAPPLPNGHGPGGDGTATKTATGSTTAIAVAPPLTPSVAIASTTPPKPSPAASGGAAAIRPGGRTELKVTFSLEVVALRLTPQLQMDVVRLQPVNRIVAVAMDDDPGAKDAILETGFRLGQVQLGTEGRIETLRLIPTRQGFQLPAAANSFAIGDLNLRRTNSHRELELVAASDQAMLVQLTAPFQLLQVELSPGFEIEALLVRARGPQVFVRNSGTSEGTRFELEKVELDPAGELLRLLVRPTS